jgi:hypothetical protein
MIQEAPQPRPRGESPNAYDMAPEALALAQAVQAWKARTGRGYPRWSELWGLLVELLPALGWKPPTQD